MLSHDHQAIADAFAAAIAAKDILAIDALLHEEAEIWHNVDQVVQDRAAALASIKASFSTIHQSRYADIRRHPIPDGFVEQHDTVMRFTPDGPELRVPCCLIAHVADGRIKRLDEYLDTSIFARLNEQDQG